MMSRTFAIAAAGLLTLAAGCESYYKVTDPTTHKVYYTKNLQHQSSGSATLTDARTGNKVSIQNSEISKISQKEYDVGRYAAPATTKPAEETPFK